MSFESEQKQWHEQVMQANRELHSVLQQIRDSSDRLERSTKRLLLATYFLGALTIGLVFLTILLILRTLPAL